MAAKNSQVLLWLKIAISTILIVVLVYGVDWQKLIVVVQDIHIGFIILAFVLMVVQFPISTIKWRAALQAHQLSHSFLYLQKILCIAFFFNNFLPTTIGGDGYRIYKTMPKEGFRSRAVSAVLLERIMGFAVLILMGFFGAIAALLAGMYNDLLFYYVLFSGAGLLAGTMFLLLVVNGYLKIIWQRWRSIRILNIVARNLSYIKNNYEKITYITAVSIVFQIMAILVIYLLAFATGAPISFYEAAYLAAIIGVAAIIPLSINGIGVVEGAFVVAAVQLGVDYNQAVVISFVLRMLVIPLSVIFGIIYLLDSDGDKKIL